MSSPQNGTEAEAMEVTTEAQETQGTQATKGAKDTNTNAAYRPTLKDIQNDSVAVLAEAWIGGTAETPSEFVPQLIERVYNDELVKHDYSITKLTLLEVSQYLEKVRLQ